LTDDQKVGDSPGQETAITVTGLKPNHFYNIRVVAVAANNFQSASSVIRLRTFGKDGKPQLGNARLPTSFSAHDQSRRGSAEDGSESDNQVHPVPSVEAAAVLDGAAAVLRDVNGTASSQRRNTVNRRHSPSVVGSDKPQFKHQVSNEPALSLEELTKKFEKIRKEIDDAQTQYTKEAAESQAQEEELKKEKERKRQMLKEKEEQTAQLKAMIRTTMEQMRAAEKEKAKKEQLLRDRESKKTKIGDSISKLEQEISRMKKERESFQKQKAELVQKRDKEVRSLDKFNEDLQQKCAELESELKDKGKQLQDLKATREQLPGANDEQWKEEEARLNQEWEAKRRDIHSRLVSELKKSHQLDQQIRILCEQMTLQPEQAGPSYYQPTGSPVGDFDGATQAQPKRLSNHGISRSPQATTSPSQAPPAEPSYPAAAPTGFAPFPPSLFVDEEEDAEPQTLAELRAASGPLSPSAQTLLPSNIFDEGEESDAHEDGHQFLPEALAASEEDPQSPASSNRSFNVFSSPHGSSHNLPYRQYSDNNADRNRPPNTGSGTTHRLTNLLSSFQRHKGPRQSDVGDDGPPIGSLKSGQSQSFPRATEENEVLEGRRRLNFPWSRGSTGQDSSSFSFSGRRLNPLKGASGGIYTNRDAEGSRPASIASTDMPRPSTDSGSIWGAPGDGVMGKNRPWPAGDGRWPSRSGSRRPSLHGTTSVMTTTLASAEDEILDVNDLLNPQSLPSQVGVIGSRPPGPSGAMNPGLNPNAPTFMGNLFRKDRDKDAGERDRLFRSKDKDRHRDKGRGKEATTPSIELPPSLDDSPAESRISRDAYSVHTQTSVSESHDSLTLDSAQSNAPSDMNSNAGSISKDQDNVVRKLFRKGSSSKFSLSSRLGKDSMLFKKGPGSTANSDKNTSADQRSSIGDADDLGEDAQFGHSYDSMASSTYMGPVKSKDSSQSRMGSWRFMKKKGKDSANKEKESLDLDRATDDD
jgi:hypothetical protein